MNYQENYIKNALYEFRCYKSLGDKSFAQLEERDLFWQYNEATNSIAIIVKHMTGNMLSRWTNFLTEDGEKLWRNREIEFENTYTSKIELIAAWEKGWHCLFDALESINSRNFDSTIKIRSEPHTIFEAVNRQIAHYASHVGQIVMIGKMAKGNAWVSLSIEKGKSEDFNQQKFNKK
jgi:hypothetical protein